LKWRANQQPEEDRAAIDGLVQNLAEVRVSRVILISTVDVYPITAGVGESFDCRSVKTMHKAETVCIWNRS
jgi:hypothetical protein